MAVYVDQPIFSLGRMRMCHMWADGLPELHAFAERLAPGLRAHFQAPPKASWEHYDIGLRLRTRALALGAEETDRYGCVEHVARLSGDRATIERVIRLRLRRATPGALEPRDRSPDLFGH